MDRDQGPTAEDQCGLIHSAALPAQRVQSHQGDNAHGDKVAFHQAGRHVSKRQNLAARPEQRVSGHLNLARNLDLITGASV